MNKPQILPFNLSCGAHPSGEAVLLSAQMGPLLVQIGIPLAAIEQVKAMLDEARRKMPKIVVPNGVLPSDKIQ